MDLEKEFKQRYSSDLGQLFEKLSQYTHGKKTSIDDPLLMLKNQYNECKTLKVSNPKVATNKLNEIQHKVLNLITDYWKDLLLPKYQEEKDFEKKVSLENDLEDLLHQKNDLAENVDLLRNEEKQLEKKITKLTNNYNKYVIIKLLPVAIVTILAILGLRFCSCQKKHSQPTEGIVEKIVQPNRDSLTKIIYILQDTINELRISNGRLNSEIDDLKKKYKIENSSVTIKQEKSGKRLSFYILKSAGSVIAKELSSSYDTKINNMIKLLKSESQMDQSMNSNSSHIEIYFSFSADGTKIKCQVFKNKSEVIVEMALVDLNKFDEKGLVTEINKHLNEL